jgi:phosphoglycerate-specific signal transduction histidine kinase
MTQTNQQIAEELLRVISNSQHHNTALALKETLEKLRELISGTNENVDWRDECNVSYVNGYDDCLHEIDKIVEELGVL